MAAVICDKSDSLFSCKAFGCHEYEEYLKKRKGNSNMTIYYLVNHNTPEAILAKNRLINQKISSSAFPTSTCGWLLLSSLPNLKKKKEKNIYHRPSIHVDTILGFRFPAEYHVNSQGKWVKISVWHHWFVIILTSVLFACIEVPLYVWSTRQWWGLSSSFSFFLH